MLVGRTSWYYILVISPLLLPLLLLMASDNQRIVGKGHPEETQSTWTVVADGFVAGKHLQGTCLVVAFLETTTCLQGTEVRYYRHRRMSVGIQIGSSEESHLVGQERQAQVRVVMRRRLPPGFQTTFLAARV